MSRYECEEQTVMTHLRGKNMPALHNTRGAQRQAASCTTDGRSNQLSQAERNGERVTAHFWSTGGNGISISLRWGVAMTSIDDWVNPRDAGQVAQSIAPPGTVEIAGGKRTRFTDGAVTFDLPAEGEGRPLGLRFVIELDDGVPYPPGGGTLFAPLREGVDLSYVIKPDYGSLEERLNKRTNLPMHLDGDGGREQHLNENRNAIHGPCGQLEGDIGRLRDAVLGRVMGWVEENRNQKAHAVQSGGGSVDDVQVENAL